MKLYEYAVILDEKVDSEGETIEEPQVVVPVQTILARDDAQAQLIAARSIPEEHVKSQNSLDRLQVVVRPF